MSMVAAQSYMTSDDFLVWASHQSGEKYELHDGVVVAMAGERRLHARVKTNAVIALSDADAPCEAYVDGIAVRVSAESIYIPDVVVDCGDQADMQAMTAAEPVIVVEVLSESTSRVDTGRKLEGYFDVPSIRHYLILDGEERHVIHHRRDGENVMTRILHDGSLTLDPPGMKITVDDFWRGLPDRRALDDT